MVSCVRVDALLVRLRLPLLIVPTVGLAATDLLVKDIVATRSWDYHQRSHGWSLAAVSLLAIVLALIVLRSRLVALSAGIVAGGILGNLVSAHGHGGEVANPLILGSVAFNLADVFVLAGIPLLVVALVRVAIKNQDLIDRLIPPRRWEIALRRKLGL
jgi:uncharacterized membrane protein